MRRVLLSWWRGGGREGLRNVWFTTCFMTVFLRDCLALIMDLMGWFYEANVLWDNIYMEV